VIIVFRGWLIKDPHHQKKITLDAPPQLFDMNHTSSINIELIHLYQPKPKMGTNHFKKRNFM
jgi:hypothetical protein